MAYRFFDIFDLFSWYFALICKGLNDDELYLFDIVFEADLFPLAQDWNRLHFLENLFDKNKLFIFKLLLLISAISWHCWNMLLACLEETIFLKLIYSHPFSWVYSEYSWKDLNQNSKCFLTYWGIVLELHFPEVISFVAFGVNLIFHVDACIKNMLLLNGKSPKSILCIKTPTAHISTLLS